MRFATLLTVIIASFVLVVSANAQLPIPAEEQKSEPAASAPAAAPVHSDPPAPAAGKKAAVETTHYVPEPFCKDIQENYEKSLQDMSFKARVRTRLVYVLTGLMIILIAFFTGWLAGWRRFWSIVLGVVGIVVFLCLFARTANAAEFACVNPLTGTRAYPLARTGVDEEIRCSIHGKLVQVKDESGAMINVTGTPASFHITSSPANVGRAKIFVDGKDVSILAIGSPREVGFGNLWLDMSRHLISRSNSSSTDSEVRRLLEATVCPDAKPECIRAFRAKAWGSNKIASHEAGVILRASIIDGTLSDPRLSKAVVDAIRAFNVNVPAQQASALSPSGGGLSQEVIDRLLSDEKRLNQVVAVQNEHGERLAANEHHMVELRNSQISEKKVIAFVGSAAVTGSRANICSAYKELLSEGITFEISPKDAKRLKGCK